MSKIRHVFVVDGDESARRGFARLLRAAGYDVRDFSTATEFLERLEPGATGCVLLDVGAAGLLCEKPQKELQARQADLPIICLSADDDWASRRMAQEVQAAAFFRKPVDGTALLDAIAWALRSQSVPGSESWRRGLR